jgi:thiol:disulfide interchange protein DsbD
MKRLLGSLLVAAFLASPAFAQSPPAATSLVHASAEGLTLAAGDKATITVHITVEQGWHTYSNPPSLDYNIPTKVSLASGFGVTAGKPAYPAGTPLKFASDEAPTNVYGGTYDVTLPLSAAAHAVNGPHTLHGKVDFQACNDQMCLAPASVPYTVDVTVTGGVSAADAAPETAATATPPQIAAAPPTPAPAPGAGFMTAPPADAGKSAQQRDLESKLSRGLLWWLLLMFGTGLALNLSPCVFPMLGITMSIFGARKTETTPRAALNASIYVLGMVIMYTGAGVVAALSGKMFSAALANPFVLVGLGLFLVVMSLSMFGLYEMQAPTWVLDRAGGANTSTMAGLFVSGLVVGIVAAPCVGPVLLGVLAILGQRGSVPFALQTMAAMSFGLGAPYLVLATSSNLLGRLPRAGDWMEWVKKLFGIVLATFGFSYVLLGIAPHAAPWLVPAALLLGALYLGFMEKSGNGVAGFRTFKRVLGVGGVLAGAVLVVMMTAARPQVGNGTSVAFRPYDESAVKASIAAGRGVMLDFGADWCVPCHELDLKVFPDASVIAAAKPFDAYKVDLTRGDSPASTHFGVHGVPTVVFLGPGGSEVRAARVEGLVEPAEFVRRLRLASTGLASR